MRAERAEGAHQAVDVGGAAAEAEAGADARPRQERRRSGRAGPAAGGRRTGRRGRRCRARPTGTGRRAARASPSTVKVTTPIRPGRPVAWPQPQGAYPVDRGEPGDQAAGEESLVRLDRPGGQRVDKSTRGGEGDRADHVRGAGLVPGGRGGPVGGAEADLADRAAARQVRRGGVQPVAAADQHARAERRVDLVPGEREVVDAGRGEVDAPVRDQLRAVDGDPRAVARARGPPARRGAGTPPSRWTRR